VDSNSSKIFELESDDVEVAGERGRAAGGRDTMLGRVSSDEVGWGRGDLVGAGGETWRPEACNALTTVAHPLSRLLILSLSSLFSRACADSLSGLMDLSPAGVN
jgi:hypothetical protein